MLALLPDAQDALAINTLGYCYRFAWIFVENILKPYPKSRSSSKELPTSITVHQSNPAKMRKRTRRSAGLVS
jgi:hypothetical protein